MKKSVLFLVVFLMMCTSSFAFYTWIRAYYYPNDEDPAIQIYGAHIYVNDVYTGYDTPHKFEPYVGGTYRLVLHTCRWTPASAEVVVIDASGTVIFGTYDDPSDPPLPVELSSFTATISATNYAMLNWVTQTETNVAGFRIFRGIGEDISSATMLNTFISATNTSQMQSYVYHDTDVYDDGTYYYWLESQDLDGSNSFYGPVSIALQLNQDPVTPPIPIREGISSIYPNPFNPNTTVEYVLDTRSPVDINVYSVRGQLTRNLLSSTSDPGYHTVAWDGKDNSGNICPSGVYYVVMKSGGQIYKRKVLMVK